MAILRGGLLVRKEEAIGTINGINVSFTTTFTYIPGTLEVSLNGLDLASGDHFTETGSNSFDLADPPAAGANPDIVLVRYQRA